MHRSHQVVAPRVRQPREERRVALDPRVLQLVQLGAPLKLTALARMKPSAEEVAANPRARSAVLRDLQMGYISWHEANEVYGVQPTDQEIAKHDLVGGPA